MQNKKILIISDVVYRNSIGGVEYWLYNLANSFNKKGWSVIHFNGTGYKVKNKIKYNAFTKINFTSGTKYRNRSIIKSIVFSISAIYYLILNRNKVDLIYMHQTPIFTSLFSRFLPKKIKNKIIIEWIEFWTKDYWISSEGKIFGTIGFLIQNFSINSSIKKVTYSKTMKKLIELELGYSIHLMPGQVSNDLFLNKFQNSKLNQIISVSRLSPEKQLLLAIEAFNEFWLNNKKYNYVIIGEGRELSKLKNLISKLPCKNNVKILKNMSKDELYDLLSKSMIMLHTSMREGFGLVLIEALSFGVPILVCSGTLNGSQDLVTFKNGIISKPNTKDISNSIKHLLNNYQSYQSGAFDSFIQFKKIKNVELTVNEIIKMSHL